MLNCRLFPQRAVDIGPPALRRNVVVTVMMLPHVHISRDDFMTCLADPRLSLHRCLSCYAVLYKFFLYVHLMHAILVGHEHTRCQQVLPLRHQRRTRRATCQAEESQTAEQHRVLL